MLVGRPPMMGDGAPPEALSNPFRLNTIFTRRDRTTLRCCSRYAGDGHAISWTRGSALVSAYVDHGDRPHRYVMADVFDHEGTKSRSGDHDPARGKSVRPCRVARPDREWRSPANTWRSLALTLVQPVAMTGDSTPESPQEGLDHDSITHRNPITHAARRRVCASGPGDGPISGSDRAGVLQRRHVVRRDPEELPVDRHVVRQAHPPSRSAEGLTGSRAARWPARAVPGVRVAA